MGEVMSNGQHAGRGRKGVAFVTCGGPRICSLSLSSSFFRRHVVSPAQLYTFLERIKGCDAATNDPFWSIGCALLALTGGGDGHRVGPSAFTVSGAFGYCHVASSSCTDAMWPRCVMSGGAPARSVLAPRSAGACTAHVGGARAV